MLKRIWHPYQLWEDFQHGMWETLPKEAEDVMLPRAVEFTGNAKLYGSYMMLVAEEWPISCEHNLTNTSMNRRAWIGHAAVALAIGCPEYITRLAWWKLTQLQRDEADEEAERAIRYFLHRWKRSGDAQLELPFTAEDSFVYPAVGETRISEWNSGRSAA